MKLKIHQKRNKLLKNIYTYSKAPKENEWNTKYRIQDNSYL